MSADFHLVARAAIDDLLASDPVLATHLGDHRWDGVLPDYTDGAMRDFRTRLDDHLTRIDGIDDVALPVEERVDLEILRARITATALALAEIDRRRWDPVVWNPGTAIYLLLSRDFAPAEERVDSVISRLQDTVRFVADATSVLGEMSHVHVETAIAQLGGFDSILDEAGTLAAGTSRRGDFEAAAEQAAAAVDGLRSWLADRLAESRRDPRLGVRLYSAALWHNLDEEVAPVQVLEAAERRLDEVTTAMREVAAQITGESVRTPDVVRQALAQIAESDVADDASILRQVRESLERATAFVRDHDLVSVPEVDTRVIEMPEFRRGVAVAYCDAPGPLETASVPTYVAVAPTPESWSPDRVASFYREYNGMLLHDLTIHEAMPGHVLQLAHARALDSPSLVRRFGMSGVFAEGWAVYAEELMIERGFAPDDRPDSHLRLKLQQLKMQARMAINAILDARVHGGDIDEREALELMMRRGFQEEGEAVGKWRRALLTATQLPTYFVGWQGIRSIVDDLRVVHPDWSDAQIHDLVLSHGAPGPRHLRSLLGL